MYKDALDQQLLSELNDQLIFNILGIYHLEDCKAAH